jgi:hypothetical protein
MGERKTERYDMIDTTTMIDTALMMAEGLIDWSLFLFKDALSGSG